MPADDQLVLDLAQHAGKNPEQPGEVRIEHGAAALEHETLLVILDQDAQALGHHVHLQIRQRVDLPGDLLHQRRKRL